METENIEQVNPLPNITEPKEKVWKWLCGTGIFTIILGMAAIFLPYIATLTIEAILAAILFIAGLTNILHAFHSNQTKGQLIKFLVGVLYGFVGIILVAFPFKGALTMTIILALLFMAVGVFKIVLALNIKPLSSWTWLLFNGILTTALGIIIWLGLPGTGRWVIGLLVGIELIFSGWVMTMFGISIKNSEMS